MHVVRAGDSLWTVTRRYRLSVEELAQLNGLERDARLEPGQSVVVRRPGGRALAAPGRPVLAPETRRIAYVVRTGDSLWSIAQRFDVSVAELRRWNRIPASAGIRIGQRLEVRIAPGRET